MGIKQSFTNQIHLFLQNLRIRPLFPLDWIRYYLLKNLGFPDLLGSSISTMIRIIKELNRRASHPIFAFSSFDLWLRSYYLKLARNFREVGRWGYVWEESLGNPMAGRFGSNLITYRLYGSLPPQLFSAVTWFMFFLALVSTGFYSDHVIFSLVLSLFLLVSPTILFSLVGYGIKPEMIWWGLAIPALYCALDGEWDIVFILLGTLMIVNTTVSIILGFMLVFPIILSILLDHYQPGFGLVWFSIGGLIRIIRIWQSFHEQTLKITLREQRDTRRTQNQNKRKLSEVLFEIRTLVDSTFKETLVLILLYLIIGWGHWLEALVLASTLIVFGLINRRSIKIADNVTEEIMMVVTGLALSLYSGAWISLIGILIIGYKDAFKVAWHVEGQERKAKLTDDLKSCGTLHQRTLFYSRLTKPYPWLEAFEYPNPQRLANFLGRIPHGSRIIMEGIAEPRLGIGFHRFRDWTNEFLPSRRIEFINHTFMNRLLEPDLTEEYLKDFSFPRLSSGIMDEACQKLGISHVIAYTQGTVNALITAGYNVVDVIQGDSYRSLSDLLYMPNLELTLLANPNPSSVILPTVDLKRSRNAISWLAQKGLTYQVKYRYHEDFFALQGTTCLHIEPYLPFTDLSTRFMEIKAEKDGWLELIYISKWNLQKSRNLTIRGIIYEPIAKN